MNLYIQDHPKSTVTLKDSTEPSKGIPLQA